MPARHNERTLSTHTGHARLRLTSTGEGVTVDGLDADGVLELRADRPTIVIGRIADVDLRVNGAYIGGRRNSALELCEGRWRIVHYGHLIPIFVNGEKLADANHRWLEDGDTIYIAANGGPDGPTFRFTLAATPGSD